MISSETLHLSLWLTRLKFDQNLTEIWPKFDRNLTTIWPEFDQNLTTIWLGFWHTCTLGEVDVLINMISDLRQRRTDSNNNRALAKLNVESSANLRRTNPLGIAKVPKLHSSNLKFQRHYLNWVNIK